MTDQKDDLAPDYIWAGPLKIGGVIDFDGYWSAQKTPFDDVEYTRSDLAAQEAEARVALAIQQAVEVCDDIQRAADEIVDNGADHSDYYQGKSFGAEQCGNKISRLPHDPEALEAYVREKVNAALEGTFRNGEEVTINGKTYVRRMILFEKGEFHPDHTAIRAMMGEGHD